MKNIFMTYRVSEKRTKEIGKLITYTYLYKIPFHCIALFLWIKLAKKYDNNIMIINDNEIPEDKIQ
jgi:hypothetical protein